MSIQDYSSVLRTLEEGGTLNVTSSGTLIGVEKRTQDAYNSVEAELEVTGKVFETIANKLTVLDAIKDAEVIETLRQIADYQELMFGCEEAQLDALDKGENISEPSKESMLHRQQAHKQLKSLAEKQFKRMEGLFEAKSSPVKMAHLHDVAMKEGVKEKKVKDAIRHLSAKSPSLFRLDIENDVESTKKIDKMLKILCSQKAHEFADNFGDCEAGKGLGGQAAIVASDLGRLVVEKRSSSLARLLFSELVLGAKEGKIDQKQLESLLVKVAEGSITGMPQQLATSRLLNSFLTVAKEKSWERLEHIAVTPKEQLRPEDHKVKDAITKVEQKKELSKEETIQYLKRKYKQNIEHTYPKALVRTAKVHFSNPRSRAAGFKKLTSQTTQMPAKLKVLDAIGMLNPDGILGDYVRHFSRRKKSP